MQPYLTINFCIALQGIFPSPELRRRHVAQPYVGEIRMFAGNFAPAGWMFCEGQLLPIAEYETLFNLIGTTYGGDGQIDLRAARPARAACRSTGQRLHARPRQGGVEDGDAHDPADPAHTPPVTGATNVAGGTGQSRGQRPCNSRHRALPYIAEAPDTASMAPQSVASAGGSQPHDNFQPYLAINFIISLFGIFPSPDLGDAMADPFVAEIRIFPFNFAPEGLGVVQRADPADLAEHRALLAARNDLRRRRQEQLRAAEPPGLRAAAPRVRARDCSLHDLGETGGEPR